MEPLIKERLYLSQEMIEVYQRSKPRPIHGTKSPKHVPKNRQRIAKLCDDVEKDVIRSNIIVIENRLTSFLADVDNDLQEIDKAKHTTASHPTSSSTIKLDDDMLSFELPKALPKLPTTTDNTIPAWSFTILDPPGPPRAWEFVDLQHNVDNEENKSNEVGQIIEDLWLDVK